MPGVFFPKLVYSDMQMRLRAPNSGWGEDYVKSRNGSIFGFKHRYRLHFNRLWSSFYSEWSFDKKNLPLKFGVFLAFFPVFLISMTLALYSVLIRDYFMLKLTETYPIMFLESVSFSLMAIFKKKIFVISRDMLTQNRQCTRT